MQQACPNIANPPPQTGPVRRAPANQDVFQACVSKLSAAYHQAVTYQPASHYWSLQWAELAIFLGATLILCGFGVWWIRRGRA